ncbi:hypothetical protein V2G26_008234 [Clonostachys chloroleuca]
MMCKYPKLYAWLDRSFSPFSPSPRPLSRLHADAHPPDAREGLAERNKIEKPVGGWGCAGTCHLQSKQASKEPGRLAGVGLGSEALMYWYKRRDVCECDMSYSAIARFTQGSAAREIYDNPVKGPGKNERSLVSDGCAILNLDAVKFASRSFSDPRTGYGKATQQEYAYK